MPSRRRPALVERALRSILAQRYDGVVEVVVVVDGPDTEPLEASVRPDFLATLNGDRGKIRVIRNQRTAGASGARNTGAAVARGELVAFCDDDDEWFADKLCEQVRTLQQHGGFAVTSGIDVLYDGRTVSRVPTADKVTFEELLRSRRPDMGGSTLLVRRDDFLHTIGPFDEQIPGSYAEDYDWLLRAARIAPILTPQRSLAAIHWHGGSFFDGRWETMIAALQYLLRKHPEFRSEPKGLARIYGQLAFASAALGRHKDARVWLRRCVGLDPRQPRAYLAVLVALPGFSAEVLLKILHQFGRGV